MNDNVLNRVAFERLQQATASQPSVLAELCRDYITEARLTLAQLRDAINQSDSAGVRERAHYLKGSSMMLGAQVLTQGCAVLEKMGRESDLTGAEPALRDALTALRDVEVELTEIVGPEALPAEGSAA